VIVDDGGARWRNRTGWLWLFFLRPVFAGVVATLSPFAIALSSSWPSRACYFIVLAAVWIAPLTLIGDETATDVGSLSASGEG
jgi:hypothetical protein